MELILPFCADGAWELDVRIRTTATIHNEKEKSSIQFTGFISVFKALFFLMK